MSMTFFMLNIFNYVLTKIQKISYSENIHRDESNFLYVIICLYIIVKKYG